MPPLASFNFAGLLALTEPSSSAWMLLFFGALGAVAVVFSRLADRLGIPILLLFMGLGMIGGSEGLGYPFEDYALAVRLGTVALVLILFDGGFNTTIDSARQVFYPSAILATVGVIATAALVAVLARLLGRPWTEAVLLGAVVSSTDAAAVFAVLRGGSLNLIPRVGRTVELESCVNDPMAVILTLTSIELILGGSVSVGATLIAVPLQLLIGGVVGVAIGYMGRALLHRITLRTVGLYPALTICLAFLSFACATLVWGSGFLAVFMTGLLLGNAPLPYKALLGRVHDAIAWASQLGMFMMMGLLVTPSRLLQVAGLGLAVGLWLTFAARPLTVWACLLPFKYPPKEVAYIGWAGLRGAVPIVLATFPVLAGVPGADRVFDAVFFVVVVSCIVPGATLRWTSKKLNLSAPEKPTPAAALEINSPHRLGGELVPYLIERQAAVCGASLREIELPSGAAVVLVVRGKELLAARGNTVLNEGDHAYVFFRPEDRPIIDLLFGRPEH
jgi:cell volume regulation protein A